MRESWLSELLRYRELFLFLVWRDITIRYKQTVLGIAWAVIQPLFTMIVFTVFFGKLAKIPTDGIPYPIFSYSALLPWTFFSAAVMNAGNSLVAHTNTWSDGYETQFLTRGNGHVDLRIDPLSLMPGRYSLSLWIERYGEGKSCDLLEHCAVLEVHASTGDANTRTMERQAGIVRLPSSWSVNQ